MDIQRVVRDLVTTKRNFWLASKSLRVVENASGKVNRNRSPAGKWDAYRGIPFPSKQNAL